MIQVRSLLPFSSRSQREHKTQLHSCTNQRSPAIEKDEKFLFPLLNILTSCWEVFSVDWLCQYFLFQVSYTIIGTPRLSKKRRKQMCVMNYDVLEEPPFRLIFQARSRGDDLHFGTERPARSLYLEEEESQVRRFTIVNQNILKSSK